MLAKVNALAEVDERNPQRPPVRASTGRRYNQPANVNRGVRIHHAEKGGVGAPALPIIGLDVAVNAAAVVEPLYALQHLPARYP